MFLFILLIANAYGVMYGLDMCTVHSVSSLQCFINNGFTFTIPRCWCSTGVWDSGCVQSVSNSHAAGMSRVDVYFFPCFSCGNPGGQVYTFWDTVIAYDMDISWVWYDLEGEWSSSYATNQAFFEELIYYTRSIGFYYGIYSNWNGWWYFFGYDYLFDYASVTPLWYPHYDWVDDFSDFITFGGWTTPAIKQYIDNIDTLCDGIVDFNYAPTDLSEYR